MSFDLSVNKMVLSALDASYSIDVGEDPEDVLNEVGDTAPFNPLAF